MTAPDHAKAMKVLDAMTPGAWECSAASWEDDTGDVRYTLGGNKIANAVDARAIAACPEAFALYRADVALDDCVARQDELVEKHGATWWAHEFTALTEARANALAAVAAKINGE